MVVIMMMVMLYGSAANNRPHAEDKKRNNKDCDSHCITTEDVDEDEDVKGVVGGRGWG